MNYDTRSPRFERASAKTGEHVRALGQVEIAEAVVRDPAARHEAAAAQDIVIVEPRLRVIAVRIRIEAGVWLECARCPLPDAAEQLAQAAGHRRRIRNGGRRTRMPQVERSGFVRARIAPRI